MPQALLQDATLQHCLALLRAVLQVRHDQVYTALRALPWPEPMTPLVRRFESKPVLKKKKEDNRKEKRK